MGRKEKLLARLQQRPKDFTLHKPHPNRIIKMYVINDILELLRREGMI